MGPFSHKILLGNNGYRGSFDINIKKKNVNIGSIRRFRAITDCWDSWNSWKTFFFQDVFQMQTVGISELGKIIRHIQNKHCFQLGGGFFLLKLNLKSFSKNNLKSQRRSEVMNSCKHVSFFCISATVRNLQKGLYLQYLSFQLSKRNLHAGEDSS